VFANVVTGCGYAGIGVNGSYNIICANDVSSCGGGSADVNDWAGIAINFNDGGPYLTDGNQVIGNSCWNNASAGIQVTGSSQASASTPYHPFGTVIANNVCYGHTTAPSSNQWPGGIIVHHGGDGTVVSGNVCYGNYFNFHFAGWNDGIAGRDGHDLVVSQNVSLSALFDGFHFADSDQQGALGNGAQQAALVMGNRDAYAGRDGFRFSMPTLAVTGYQVQHNISRQATGYGFNVTTAANFTGYTWADNTALTPGTAATNNVALSSVAGLTGAIATGATVTHGLGTTPQVVLVTANDAGPTDITVTAKGATTFTINFGGGGTHTFGWEAFK
jgi:hypothetical protein